MNARAILVAASLIGLALPCAAEESSSDNYTLERSVVGAAGGETASANYTADWTLRQSTP